MFISSKKFKVNIILGGALLLDKYSKVIQIELLKNFDFEDTIFFQVEGETNLTMLKSCSMAMNEIGLILNKIKPDFLVVLADRFETIALAVAGSFLNIKLIHIEGGENSGSIDDKIRNAVTQFSDIHFTCTDKAKKKIIKMGIKSKNVMNVGSTSFDEIKKINLTNIKFFKNIQKDQGTGSNLDIKKKNYLIVAQHPVTTEYKDNLKNINESIRAISEIKIPIIWIWPNMDAGSDGISKGIRNFREKLKPENIFFIKSLAIEYFAPLLNNACCIIGNSSTGIREASFLGVPTVNIGTRQKNREQGENVINVAYDSKIILNAIKKQISTKSYKPNYLYGDGNASQKIYNFILKYKG